MAVSKPKEKFMKLSSLFAALALSCGSLAHATTFQTATCSGQFDLGDMGTGYLRATIQLVSPTAANMKLEEQDGTGWQQICLTGQPLKVQQNQNVDVLTGDLGCKDGWGTNQSISLDTVAKTFTLYGIPFTCDLN
jgi:hypothetical protein